jgi:hypothetical protein
MYKGKVSEQSEADKKKTDKILTIIFSILFALFLAGLIMIYLSSRK